jgi:hypothetical protein
MSEEVRTPTSVAADPHAIVKGHCSLCGCGLNSATAKYCVRCYWKCCRRCPECTTPKGAVLWKYQKHAGMPLKRQEDGTCQPRLCNRCNERHSEDRQLVCATCGNERVVFEVPREKPGD